MRFADKYADGVGPKIVNWLGRELEIPGSKNLVIECAAPSAQRSWSALQSVSRLRKLKDDLRLSLAVSASDIKALDEELKELRGRMQMLGDLGSLTD